MNTKVVLAFFSIILFTALTYLILTFPVDDQQKGITRNELIDCLIEFDPKIYHIVTKQSFRFRPGSLAVNDYSSLASKETLDMAAQLIDHLTFLLDLSIKACLDDPVAELNVSTFCKNHFFGNRRHLQAEINQLQAKGVSTSPSSSPSNGHDQPCKQKDLTRLEISNCLQELGAAG